ncbi:hypothetical protein FQA39_LY06260 [Lamprigera yunnana]|nr:hypothetical protein FQA39_LY06260 [Lamprigera yunnana]
MAISEKYTFVLYVRKFCILYYRLSLTELINILDESVMECGNTLSTLPKDSEDTDVDSDKSVHDHDGDICHSGSTVVKTECEYVPARTCNPETSRDEQYDLDDRIPLATLFPNAMSRLSSDNFLHHQKKKRKTESKKNRDIKELSISTAALIKDDPTDAIAYGFLAR